MVGRLTLGAGAARGIASRPVARAHAALLVAICWAGCGGGLAAEEAAPPSTVDAGPDTRIVPFVPEDAAIDTTQPNPYAPGPEAGNFVEDACPVRPPPPTQYECDPLSTDDCPMGTACYPFPPSGVDPCTPGPFVMRCAREGSGTQGDACGNGSSCRAGYVCAVTGQGDQCLKLCRPGSIGACPDGMVCGRLDIPGIGGCL